MFSKPIRVQTLKSPTLPATAFSVLVLVSPADLMAELQLTATAQRHERTVPHITSPGKAQNSKLEVVSTVQIPHHHKT